MAQVPRIQSREKKITHDGERETGKRHTPVIGVDGVADGDVEGPVGAQQQLVGGLVHAHRRRGRHLFFLAPSEEMRR